MGNDDDSQQVKNLPKAPPPRGQMELISLDGDEMTGSQTTGESEVGQEVK